MVKLKEPYLPILLLESNKISKQQNRISFRGNNHDLKVKSECGHQNYKQMSKIATLSMIIMSINVAAEAAAVLTMRFSL